MKWLNKLERKLGRFSIRGLMGYIIGFNVVVLLFAQMDPMQAWQKLALSPYLVMHGEVWRLVTYIFIPPSFSIFWAAFILYFYYLVGTNLEYQWGSFKFNIYYLIGMLGTTVAAFLSGYGVGAQYLNLSLYLAFARLFPDFEILLFFILPVKIKYLAYLQWFYIVWTLLMQPLPFKIAALASVVNYFIFFGKEIFVNSKNRRAAFHNRENFRGKLPKSSSIHRCTVCGITENDNPTMEFRYCSKCDGNYEYCMPHLTNHEHIKDGHKE